MASACLSASGAGAGLGHGFILFICFGRCCCWSLGSTLARSLKVSWNQLGIEGRLDFQLLFSEVEENRELAAAWQFCSRLAELIKECVGARLKGCDPCRWRVL